MRATGTGWVLLTLAACGGDPSRVVSSDELGAASPGEATVGGGGTATDRASDAGHTYSADGAAPMGPALADASGGGDGGPRDGGAEGAPSGEAGPRVPPGIGHVVFRLAQRWRRLSAAPGAPMQDLTAALDAISPGSDDQIALAASGAWLVLQTTRFGCQDYGCIALVKGDLSGGALVKNGGEIHAQGRPAVSASGDRIVFPSHGPHAMDVWAIARTGATWSQPVLLTAASSHPYHHDLAISADGTKAVFDCGNDPYGAGGTDLCEAHTDGTGFRVLGVAGNSSNALHHGGYAPDDSVVFEGAWSGEQVWRLPTGSSTPAQASPTQTNDNSPCVLPNGRIVSLWLEAPENPSGRHELKTMTASGASWEMLLTGVDVEDIGMTCGE